MSIGDGVGHVGAGAELWHFAGKVREMREAQDDFFRARKSGDDAAAQAALRKSKALESWVDRACREILQPSLFGPGQGGRP